MPRLRGTTDYIVVHYSNTPLDTPVGVRDIWRTHRAAGFFDIGYHYVILRDGTVAPGRTPSNACGAHCSRYNAISVAICLVGPLGDFRPEQMEALWQLCQVLVEMYPGARVIGHSALNRRKAGPGFDVEEWWHDRLHPPPATATEEDNADD